MHLYTNVLLLYCS